MVVVVVADGTQQHGGEMAVVVNTVAISAANRILQLLM